jgi:hypothetical protein
LRPAPMLTANLNTDSDRECYFYDIHQPYR